MEVNYNIIGGQLQHNLRSITTSLDLPSTTTAKMDRMSPSPPVPHATFDATRRPSGPGGKITCPHDHCWHSWKNATQMPAIIARLTVSPAAWSKRRQFSVKTMAYFRLFPPHLSQNLLTSSPISSSSSSSWRRGERCPRIGWGERSSSVSPSSDASGIVETGDG